MNKYLVKAVKILGGQNKTAQALSVSQSNVYYWLNDSKMGVPPQHCAKLEELSGIPKHHLRPDIFPKPETANG